MIKIIANGYDEKEFTIDELLAKLEEHALDSSFEKFGNFIHKITEENAGVGIGNLRDYIGCTQFFGNFLEYSHLFNIITDDEEIIEKLTLAIRKNQQRDTYSQPLKIIDESPIVIQDTLINLKQSFKVIIPLGGITNFYQYLGRINREFNNVKLRDKHNRLLYVDQDWLNKCELKEVL